MHPTYQAAPVLASQSSQVGAVELTKNAAEIGHARFLYAVRAR